jgi:hypothetical protein
MDSLYDVMTTISQINLTRGQAKKLVGLLVILYDLDLVEITAKHQRVLGTLAAPTSPVLVR